MCLCTNTPRRHKTYLVGTLALLLSVQGCAPGPVRHAPGGVSAASTATLTDEAQTQYQTALGLIDSGQAADAQAILFDLVTQHPGLSGAWTNLGILQARGDDPAAALLSFTKACQSNPKNLIAWNWQASLLRQQGHHLDAEQAYLAALRVEDTDAPTHRNLALLYDLDLGQPQKALSHYRRYQQLSDDNPLIVQAWIRRLEDRLDSAQTHVAEQHTP